MILVKPDSKAISCIDRLVDVKNFLATLNQFYHNKSISGQGNLRSICVDRLNFNTDGTIQTVPQTTAGPPAVSPTSAPAPATKYEAENAVVGNGATVANDSAASGGKCIQNLHNANAYIQFNNVNGGNVHRAV
jgi:hypothetical protein